MDRVPDAHLLVIATGLDPVTHRDHGLFDNATAQVWNSAASNAEGIEDFRANIRAILEQAGVSPEALAQRIDALRASSKITDDAFQVYTNRMKMVFSLPNG